MPDVPDYEQPRYSEIVMDWHSFDRLPAGEQKTFLEIMKAWEKGDWIRRTDYEGVCEWACVDLDQYEDYDAFVRTLKKRGASFYEGRKAEKLGYYTKFFTDRTFIGDITAIETSAPERQGRPLPDNYFLTVEQRGGYPTEFIQPAVPDTRVFWIRRFGTFRASPGRFQGDVVVDEELVSYLSIRRLGNFACYSMILGHTDLLRDGIVHKMHLDFVKLSLDNRNRSARNEGPVDDSLLDLRYVGYAGYFGASPGLKRWKKSNLFEPIHFRLDYTRILEEAAATD